MSLPQTRAPARREPDAAVAVPGRAATRELCASLSLVRVFWDGITAIYGIMKVGFLNKKSSLKLKAALKSHLWPTNTRLFRRGRPPS